MTIQDGIASSTQIPNKTGLQLLTWFGPFLAIVAFIAGVVNAVQWFGENQAEYYHHEHWLGLVSFAVLLLGLGIYRFARKKFKQYFREVRKGEVIEYSHDYEGFYFLIRGETKAGEKRDYKLRVDVETWRKYKKGDVVDFSGHSFTWED